MDLKKILMAFVLFIAIGTVIGAFYAYFFSFKSTLIEEGPQIARNDQASLNELVPRNTKNPEEFMQKVQAKAQEIQKNYDSNLTEFAQKRWEKLFLEQNKLDKSFISNDLKVLSSEVTKDAQGNTIYNIKYRLADREIEDYYYLLVTGAKLNELGLTGIKANGFLTEEEIKKNINIPNFSKIEKIK